MSWCLMHGHDGGPAPSSTSVWVLILLAEPQVQPMSGYASSLPSSISRSTSGCSTTPTSMHWLVRVLLVILSIDWLYPFGYLHTRNKRQGKTLFVLHCILKNILVF